MTGGWTSFPRAERSAGIQIPVWRRNARLDSRSGLRGAGMTGCWIHHACSVGALDLSPGVLGCAKLRLPLPATGRGWAHSPSSWQRAAPGRRAEWLEIREARTQPFPVKCQQWRGAGDRPSGSRCDGARSGNGQRAPEAKECPGTEIAGAGAVRQPPGREALRARKGSPRRPARVPPGAGRPAPRLPTRHPRTRRTSGPSAGDGRRVGSGWQAGCRVFPAGRAAHLLPVVRQAHHGVVIVGRVLQEALPQGRARFRRLAALRRCVLIRMRSQIGNMG